MSNMGDSVRNPNNAEDFLKFISIISPQVMDKAQLLVDTFGECANLNNFASQVYGDMGDDTDLEYPSEDDELFTSTSSLNTKITPNLVLETPPILPDVEMTPVDQTVIPKTSWKKNKQKACVTDDKQLKNPVGKEFTVPEATQILTGYKEADDQRKQVRDIIVYDIPYTWDVEKILGELTLWGHTIKLSVKQQHKYQTLRVKIVLNSFTLPQFTKFWTTNLGEMTMATLWADRKPLQFLMMCIQISKEKRKLVGYFENWEATLKALDTSQVFSIINKEA
ncbi:hypothetical protein RhiirA5_436781 [Rhizophagus irregularis]|uniref:Uncharacterized protein n=1 Tax=Rhizophagus irregularis TaxID=588596 RepID=A0A2N0NLH4_9GLOM|nr:hypothetical protein RhiirA5_436781 [Rhizophagus irregularis]PKC53927.1 hypothetical protein RhiirA1_478292 [Rhizophagus irregularis]